MTSASCDQLTTNGELAAVDIVALGEDGGVAVTKQVGGRQLAACMQPKNIIISLRERVFKARREECLCSVNLNLTCCSGRHKLLS